MGAVERWWLKNYFGDTAPEQNKQRWQTFRIWIELNLQLTILWLIVAVYSDVSKQHLNAAVTYLLTSWLTIIALDTANLYWLEDNKTTQQNFIHWIAVGIYGAGVVATGSLAAVALK
jgi:hypothetical protein